MAQNKSDNHIKNLLEQRSITPSENTWSKLETRLDAEDKKSKRPWLWLSGLAATLVGVLLMVNLSSKKEITNGLVVTPSQPKEVSINNSVKVTDMAIVGKDSSLLKSNKDKKATQQNVLPNVKTVVPKTNNNSRVTSIKKKKTPDSERVYHRLYASNTNTEKKKQTEVFFKNSSNKQESVLNKDYASLTTNTVNIEAETLSEAEKLLIRAFAVTEKEQSKVEKIDAASLLEEVEFEVEETFRTKVFKKIKNNVIDLKNTIVDRKK